MKINVVNILLLLVGTFLLSVSSMGCGMNKADKEMMLKGISSINRNVEAVSGNLKQTAKDVSDLGEDVASLNNRIDQVTRDVEGLKNTPPKNTETPATRKAGGRVYYSRHVNETNVKREVENRGSGDQVVSYVRQQTFKLDPAALEQYGPKKGQHFNRGDSSFNVKREVENRGSGDQVVSYVRQQTVRLNPVTLTWAEHKKGQHFNRGVREFNTTRKVKNTPKGDQAVGYVRQQTISDGSR